ncbi:MAG: hypothetical protein AABW91_01370 [Nanoarchaeota archaeon]
MLQLKEKPKTEPLEIYEVKPSFETKPKTLEIYEPKLKVEILLGVYNKGSNEKVDVDSCSVFSLYIDGLRTMSTRYFYIDRTVNEHCKEVSRDYGEFMLANELDSYSLKNGEMSDHKYPEAERFKCSPISAEGVEIFKKTLDSMLGR